MHRLLQKILLLGFALIVCAGCQSEARSPLGERVIVKGKVNSGGKMLAAGAVVFTPVDSSKGDEQAGQVNAAGEYVNSVFPGKYKVWMKDARGIPVKYQSADSTDLEIEITKSGKEDANFDLK